MAWNYRVFCTRFRDLVGGEEDVYTLREAYYAPDGQLCAITGNQAGASASGATLTELMKDHARLQEAFHRPVLTPHDVPGYTYDEQEVPLGGPDTGGHHDQEETR